LSDRVDEWLMDHLREFGGKKLQNVARGDLDMSSVETDDDKKQRESLIKEHGAVAERIKKVLEGRVGDVKVTTRLSESPAVLVLGENDMGAQMRRILEAAGQKAPDVQPTLEINPTHPLLQRLEGLQAEEEFKDLSLLLLEQATLADGGQLAEPAEFVRRLNRLLFAKS
jgi:molecular chaperone HtpG